MSTSRSGRSDRVAYREQLVSVRVSEGTSQCCTIHLYLQTITVHLDLCTFLHCKLQFLALITLITLHTNNTHRYLINQITFSTNQSKLSRTTPVKHASSTCATNFFRPRFRSRDRYLIRSSNLKPDKVSKTKQSLNNLPIVTAYEICLAAGLL